MTVVLSHKSALKALLIDRSVTTSLRYCIPQDASASITEIRQAQERLSLGAVPLDALTLGANRQTHSPEVARIHLACNLRDTPAFLKIDEVYVSSPELCFVQLAADMHFVKALLFGYYLCGDYRPARIRAITGDQPLSNVAKLTEFVNQLPQTKGKLRAKRVLRYIIDGSNSPWESRLTIVIILPHRFGGFGLVHPKLNQLIPGTTKKGDLCWLDEKLILEYDSNENHASDDQINADSIRRATIELSNFRVISVTAKQLQSLAHLNELGRLVTKKLGKKFRIRSQQFNEKQRELHRELFLCRDYGF